MPLTKSQVADCELLVAKKCTRNSTIERQVGQETSRTYEASALNSNQQRKNISKR